MPLNFQQKKIIDQYQTVMSPFPEFASYQSLKFESISVEAFTFGKDQYVVFAQPFAGTCSFLEWDHVEMTFRTYDTIESEYA